MNLLKTSAVACLGLAGWSKQDILFVVSICLTVLGMIQDYLNDR
ncbi:hypothetical protein ES705_36982 [subsurface metagenome]